MSVERFFRLEEIENGLYQLIFDTQDSRVNILSKSATAALAEVVSAMPCEKIRGLIIRSEKKSFVMGADITEFFDAFEDDEEVIFDYGMTVHNTLNQIEDFPFPTVALVSGEALGGGFELALSTDFRVLSENAKVGLPEVNLGIMPGWGGSVRLPRLIGVDTALTWMTQGRPMKAAEALRVGAANSVVKEEQLFEAGLKVLKQAVAGDLDHQSHRDLKTKPLAINDIELSMACDTALGMLSMMVSPHYPAATTIVKSVRDGVRMERKDAGVLESKKFIKLAKSPVARNLVTLFLNDQALKKTNNNYARSGEPVNQAAVLGAGIMGGGVAYQSATTGSAILMKDIADSALTTGMNEANRLMTGQIKRGRMKPEAALTASQLIKPTLSYHDFANVDMVVEAVVENPKIKQSVLAEVEQHVGDDCVLATNTSTLTVKELVSGLKRPENFCGMHFFNPVHRMPLVEIIRGEKTSDAAISRAVNYALAMRKVPVVVNDCPGFLVNRILLPYVHAFARLVMAGVNFERIDKVMEKFGWPMGPATLADIVGMDTGHHAEHIIADAYPDRYLTGIKTPTDVLFEAGRLGQKSGSGYYRYELDKRGKPKKVSDPEAHDLLKSVVSSEEELSDEQIIQRMMIPLCLEAVRCLEDGIAQSAGDIDVALVNGIGYPRYLGGAFGYIETLGLSTFVEQCSQYQHLGKAYQPTERLVQMATAGESFFSVAAAGGK